MIQPKKSRRYDVLYRDLCMLVQKTELVFNTVNSDFSSAFFLLEKTVSVSFKSSSLTNINGKKIYFDGLSEDQFVFVMNGGYYEEAPAIIEAERI